MTGALLMQGPRLASFEENGEAQFAGVVFFTPKCLFLWRL